jgi:hypothetical protein
METLIGGVASFVLFHFTTRPKSKINRKYPQVKIKRIQILPSFHIEAKNKIFHVHHWMWITPLYLAIQTIGRGITIFQSDILHGLMIGGIVQGLMFEDSFKLVHHNDDYYKKIKATSYHRFKFLKKLSKRLPLF